MTRFRITYTDPETQERVSVVREFADTPGIGVREDGTTFNVGPIKAREWAEDFAYAVADKGPYTIERLN